jgi:hypothetical protein
MYQEKSGKPGQLSDDKKSTYPPFWRRKRTKIKELFVAEQGCQIFLGTMHQNWGKCIKWPNDLIWNFWSENKPSGNLVVNWQTFATTDGTLKRSRCRIQTEARSNVNLLIFSRKVSGLFLN